MYNIGIWKCVKQSLSLTDDKKRRRRRKKQGRWDVQSGKNMNAVFFFSLKLQLLRFIWKEARTRERERKSEQERKRKKVNPFDSYSSYQKKQYEWMFVCWSSQIEKQAKEKGKLQTYIAFDKQSGNNDKRKKTTMTSNRRHNDVFFACYPMMKKVVDSTLESWMPFTPPFYGLNYVEMTRKMILRLV